MFVNNKECKDYIIEHILSTYKLHYMYIQIDSQKIQIYIECVYHFYMPDRYKEPTCRMKMRISLAVTAENHTNLYLDL